MTLNTVLLILILAPLLFALGVAIYVYTWLRISPIDVKPTSSNSARLASIDRWLDSLFEKGKFNGGVLILRDGEPLLSKTCGYTSHDATSKLDDHSAFRLASVSKQFTAVGILRLVDQTRLNLDDRLDQLVQDFPCKGVTVRHLLNQTSGIPDEYMQLANKHRDSLGEFLTIGTALNLIARHTEPIHPPGDRMSYSNTNYVLLAGIVEVVSGLNFETFMAQEVFHPLEMNDTRVWNLASKNRSEKQAFDFEQIDDKRTALEPSWLDGVAGDGAVFSSLHDLIIWDRFWMGTTALLPDRLLAQALERPKLNDGSISNYGFGWMIDSNRHWHNGAWLGANTYIVRYPESRCCLAVLDNSSNLRVDRIAAAIESSLQPIFSP